MTTTTTVTTPEARNVTSAPTLFALMNSSQQEDLEIKILQVNSSASSINNKYSTIFRESSSLKISTWAPITSNLSLSNVTNIGNISVIKPCNSSEDGFGNKKLLIPSLVITPNYHYSTEVPEAVSSPTDVVTKHKVILSEWVSGQSPTTTHGRTSEISSKEYHPDSFSLAPVTPVSGIDVSLTTVAPIEIGAQINTPGPADPYIQQPAGLDDVTGDDSEHKTTSEHSVKESSTHTTKGPFLQNGSMPEDQGKGFKRMLLNDSDPEHPREAINVHADVYWMVGNWSEVSIGVSLFRSWKCRSLTIIFTSFLPL